MPNSPWLAPLRPVGRFGETLLDRVLCVLGAVGVSQAPEFFQQYLQRLGGHLDEARRQLASFEAVAKQSGITLQQLTKAHVGSVVRLIGMLNSTKRLQTKKGDAMLVGQVEDLDGMIEFVAFPKVYEQYRELLVDDAIATYQTASWLFKHAAQRELNPEEFKRCAPGEK